MILYYAIQQMGYGKKTRFLIKAVFENGTGPVTATPDTFRAHRTEDAARAAAAAAGIQIEKAGDYYDILP